MASLLEFQHFQQFLNSRIERLKSNKERDLFDEEAITYEEEIKSAKWSSEQMKVAFKDIKVSCATGRIENDAFSLSLSLQDILQKHSTKVARNTKTLMKDTKNLFQGKGNVCVREKEERNRECERDSEREREREK